MASFLDPIRYEQLNDEERKEAKRRLKEEATDLPVLTTTTNSVEQLPEPVEKPTRMEDYFDTLCMVPSWHSKSKAAQDKVLTLASELGEP